MAENQVPNDVAVVLPPEAPVVPVQGQVEVQEPAEAQQGDPNAQPVQEPAAAEAVAPTSSSQVCWNYCRLYKAYEEFTSTLSLNTSRL